MERAEAEAPAEGKTLLGARRRRQPPSSHVRLRLLLAGLVAAVLVPALHGLVLSGIRGVVPGGAPSSPGRT